MSTLIRRADANTLRHLINSLEFENASVRGQAAMWLEELEHEPDLLPAQMVKITARIQRLTAEATLLIRQIMALHQWSKVDEVEHDVVAVQLLINRYQMQAEDMERRAARYRKSAWEHERQRSRSLEDRVDTLTRYQEVLERALEHMTLGTA